MDDWSGVPVTSIFGADEGEFFIHRNIAGLVPLYNADGIPWHLGGGRGRGHSWRCETRRVSHVWTWLGVWDFKGLGWGT